MGERLEAERRAREARHAENLKVVVAVCKVHVNPSGTVRVRMRASTKAALTPEAGHPVEARRPDEQRALCVLSEVDRLRASFDQQRAHSLRQMPRSLEEVLMMAAYLGMRYGGELGTEHLWIADAALCLQLPLGWTQYADERDEHPYYENVITAERMWEHPQLAFLRGVVAAVNAAHSTLHPNFKEERGSESDGPMLANAVPAHGFAPAPAPAAAQ